MNTSSLEKSVSSKKSLEEMSIEITPAEKRQNGGIIRYTTLEQTLLNYAEDPFGEKTFQFLADAYGISDPEQFFQEAGLEGYLEAKKNGAYIGALKSHGLVADPYNFSDIMVGGAIGQRYDIPTAVMALGYSDDIFVSSPEKMSLFGAQPYFIGYDQKGKPQFTSITIVPTAIRDNSGNIKHIDVIDEAAGVPLKDIFVDIRRPLDPRNAHAFHRFDSERSEEYIEAAIGMSKKQILSNPLVNEKNPGMITVTQLHRVLFEATIQRLRRQGYLGDEAQMPIIYAELGDLSHALIEHSTYVPQTLETLGFAGSPNQILTELLCSKPSAIDGIIAHIKTNGLVVELPHELKRAISSHHTRLSNDEIAYIQSMDPSDAALAQAGIMKELNLKFNERSGLLMRGHKADPASYYPAFSALLNQDQTSLDEDWYFAGKMLRSQKLLDQHDVPLSVVKIPYEDIDTFSTTRIHPTGTYYDIKGADGAVSQKKILPARQAMSKQQLTKDQLRQKETDLQTIKRDEMYKIYRAIQEASENSDPNEWKRTTEAIATDDVICWWYHLISALPEDIDFSRIQK